MLTVLTVLTDANSDRSHEIKRHLLLGRKAITNLDSILKSRYITLPTKIHIVKAMVFSVITYRCESWTVKKRLITEELMSSNCDGLSYHSTEVVYTEVIMISILSKITLNS